ncbi:serine protein kinase PrkA [bacterium]|nr:serine protein kinase PrkA [bacterium]
MPNKAFEKVIENLTLNKSFKSLKLEGFLNEFSHSGQLILRNIFQLFNDMVHFYMREVKEEFPFDSELVGFFNYNFDDLFINKTEKPFFADRLFANRLVNLANSFRMSAARNKIYIFKGPAGSGKSTFLNNLLTKFEDYIRSDEGLIYEVVWRIPSEKGAYDPIPISHEVEEEGYAFPEDSEGHFFFHGERLLEDTVFEVPCPNHDNPVLLIPKEYRANLLREIVPEGEFKKRLFKHKQYQWVFQDQPCTICSSIFDALIERFTIRDVFSMIFARRYFFHKKQGIGISVFNSGDDLEKVIVRENEPVQKFLNEFFQDSNKVKYLFSSYSSTNQGIRALMDLKAKNVQRFLDLHGIISDEVHKVSDLEERIKSLFIVLMNPGDLEHIGEQNKKDESSIDHSLKDRIHEILVPYVLDFNTEIKIYINTFGDQIKLRFMPHVLENFAKTVISSRIKHESKAIQDWVKDEVVYKKYCDPDFLILKMYFYAGIIPDWLSKEDRSSLKAEVWKNLLAESESEGHEGFSGRESNQIFDEFYSKYSKRRPITMKQVGEFFLDENRELKKKIPKDFLKHLTDLYDFEVLKEVKDSMYDYNEEEISKTILNYLVAITQNIGDTVKNPYINFEEVLVTSDFLDIVETHLIGHNAYPVVKERFRREAIAEYASVTLAKEIKVEGKKITESNQYLEMFSQFTKTARQKVLEPYGKNNNFRIAIKEFGTEDFLKYDTKIREKIKLLFANLSGKYGYTQDCAKTVCLYVLDNNLADKFEF